MTYAYYIRIIKVQLKINPFSLRRIDVKRKDLIKLLEKNGWTFKRNGSNHDLYTDGKRTEPIPRHSEINERLAKSIIKKLGL